MRTRAFTVIEVLIACAILIVLSMVLFAALQQTARMWRKSSAKDDAMAQILRCKARLTRDLANSSAQPGRCATTTVGPHLGSGKDGDALTFLSSDNGSGNSQWTLQPDGEAAMASQITWYLVIPASANPYHLTPGPGPPDAAGYEQQHPCKWLMRRVDPVTPGPALDPNWQTWLVQPTAVVATPTREVVADQLLSFRVVPSPAPRWTLELSAVAIADATRQLAVGTVPLGNSTFTLVERFAVPAGN